MNRGKRTEQRRRVIRPCRLTDIADVLELWKRAEAPPSVTDDQAALRRRLERDRRLFLVAVDGRRLVGTLMGGWDGWRASMARLAVDPAYRRQGLAREMVAAVERELRAMGARRITGLVLRDNGGGNAFWRAAGYELDPHIRRYVKDLA